jgi:hypothetical protein
MPFSPDKKKASQPLLADCAPVSGIAREVSRAAPHASAVPLPLHAVPAFIEWRQSH